MDKGYSHTRMFTVAHEGLQLYTKVAVIDKSYSHTQRFTVIHKCLQSYSKAYSHTKPYSESVAKVIAFEYKSQ
jgi:hypothetical protein